MKYGSVKELHRYQHGARRTRRREEKELGINTDVDGVYVMEVAPKGAAAQAGLQKGDVIVKSMASR